uniref:Endonuclease/exonuclease/phosphatase domain-containing protein n=1 Tax=Clytia hemisphaerica TaxID=252671 RepID=A0A7M5X672_9CNID
KKSKPIVICSLYRPPCSKAIKDTGRYTQYLSSCFENLPKGSEVFILGDFNVDMSKKNNLSSLISELCKSKVLTEHVSSTTRVTEYSSTMIDLAISKNNLAEDCSVVYIGISDHSLVFLR